MAILTLPKILFENMITFADINFITKKKQNGAKFTGVMNVNSSKHPILMDKLKDCSKQLNVTINDMVLCALSTAVNTLFEENDTPQKSMKVIMPA